MCVCVCARSELLWMRADYITLQLSERKHSEDVMLCPCRPAAPVSAGVDAQQRRQRGGRREGSEPLRETRGSMQPPPNEVRLFPDRNGYGSNVEKILF